MLSVSEMSLTSFLPRQLEATYIMKAEAGLWIEILCLAPASRVNGGELLSLSDLQFPHL